MIIIVQNESVTDERIRTLIDEELKPFGIQQGDSTKKIDDINTEFIKNHSNSLAHRAEGKYLLLISIILKNIYLAAKIMLLINPKNNLKAIEYLTTFDSNFLDQNLKVCFGFFLSRSHLLNLNI